MPPFKLFSNATFRLTKNVVSVIATQNAMPVKQFSNQSASASSTNLLHQTFKLPVIDKMVKLVKAQGLPDLSKTVVIGVQHMLETTACLFDALIELGIKPTNMYFSGKCYSSSVSVENTIRKSGINLMPTGLPKGLGLYQEHCREGIKNMWQACIKDLDTRSVDRIIILDKNGRCLEEMPEYVSFQHRVAGIEQTLSGLYVNSHHNLPFPLVDVASSAVKKLIEPPLIAAAVLNKVKTTIAKLNLDKHTVCGVIGNGAIGSAVAKHLLSLGYSVLVYDADESDFKEIYNNRLYRMKNVESLIASAQCIFGCTGRDVTAGLNIFDIVKKDKILISCTSEDKEFMSFLKAIAKESRIIPTDPLSDIKCRSNNGSKILILGGGFPINFDRKAWNVPTKDIEVTQGLLLGSCLQAIYSASKPVNDSMTINEPSRQALDPYIQRWVVENWIDQQPSERYTRELIEKFQNLEFIVKHSDGIFYENKYFASCFAKKPQLSQNIPKAKL